MLVRIFDTNSINQRGGWLTSELSVGGDLESATSWWRRPIQNAWSFLWYFAFYLFVYLYCKNY